jgi:2-dehydro-3-deoxygalactonokinase
LATLLFGARARVMRGQLERKDAASYLRGLLIGSEIADALAIHPDLGAAPVPLIGNGPLCALYAGALASVGAEGRLIDSREACVHGFLALNSAAQASYAGDPGTQIIGEGTA